MKGLNLPDSFHLKPGGELRYNSYNDTFFKNPAVAANFTAFVVNASYFQFVANITSIEFVPITKGNLIIEVGIFCKS